jgi:hypothetical protein
VHLAVLARSSAGTLSDVDTALHQRRSLVRWMGMRRTLFVLPRDVVQVVEAAAWRSVAALMRRQLIRRLELNGAEPAIPEVGVHIEVSSVIRSPSSPRGSGQRGAVEAVARKRAPAPGSAPPGGRPGDADGDRIAHPPPLVTSLLRLSIPVVLTMKQLRPFEGWGRGRRSHFGARLRTFLALRQHECIEQRAVLLRGTQLLPVFVREPDDRQDVYLREPSLPCW